MQIPELKPRDVDAHKGQFGRVLLIGGSRGMSGSVALSGMSALRSGAGLTTIAVPDTCLETVAGFNACYMTVPLPDDDFGRIAIEADEILRGLSYRATSVGIGPGLSQSEAVTSVVKSLYERYTGPMIVDADALNALASLPDGLPIAAGTRVLTPHLGEFRRLARDSKLSPNECRDAAKTIANANNVIVVVKGHRTLVTDGTSHFENSTGNPGMATGGSGDVLTGIITALAAQNYSPMEAAVMGVHIHGLAGDLACQAVGEISLTADDIVGHLPAAFRKQLRESRSNSKMGF